MSSLSFQYFCCNCFQQLSPQAGVILSCRDFVCNNCLGSVRDRRCPACREENVQLAQLRDAPDEIGLMLHDPSESLEKYYNLLKFQIGHYKSMLERASKTIGSLSRQLKEANTALSGMKRDYQSISSTGSIGMIGDGDQGSFFNKRHAGEDIGGSRPSSSSSNSGGLTWKSGPQRESVVIQSNLKSFGPPTGMQRSASYSQQAQPPTNMIPTTPSNNSNLPLLTRPLSVQSQLGMRSYPSQTSQHQHSQQQPLQRAITPSTVYASIRPGSGQSVNNPVTPSTLARVRSPHMQILPVRTGSSSGHFQSSVGKSSSASRYTNG